MVQTCFFPSDNYILGDASAIMLCVILSRHNLCSLANNVQLLLVMSFFPVCTCTWIFLSCNLCMCSSLCSVLLSLSVVRHSKTSPVFSTMFGASLSQTVNRGHSLAVVVPGSQTAQPQAQTLAPPPPCPGGLRELVVWANLPGRRPPAAHTSVCMM